jgi:CCR4-NOT transcriptional regulation complex NOT5 subunit
LAAFAVAAARSTRSSSTVLVCSRAAPRLDPVAIALPRASRSFAAAIAAEYCGSHASWATSSSSTICHTSGGLHTAPTSGSMSIAWRSRVSSPRTAASTARRCTEIEALQIAAQPSGQRRERGTLMPLRST